MAKSKRAADAAPASSKRSRKSTAAAAAAGAEAEQQQHQQQQHSAVTQLAEKATGRRRKQTQAAAAAAATAAAADAKAGEADAAPPKQQRKGRGGKASAAEAEAADAAAAEVPAAAAAKPAAKRKPAAAAAAADKPKPPYYLVKSEPDEFSIEMLKQRPNQTEGWEGVRNYVARNHLRAMKVGDRAFFYHSSCKVPGIVGIVEVVREAYPDLTAQDKSSKYFDAKASAEDPRWSMVDFKLVRELKRQITLEELKAHKDGALSSMALFTTARLSVQPVSQAEWDFVLSLEEKEP